jgi:hypothetical protein
LEVADTIFSCLLEGVDGFCLLERACVDFLEDVELLCGWLPGVVDPLGLEGDGKGIVGIAWLEALVLCFGSCVWWEEALLATTAEGFDELMEEGTGPVESWGLGRSIREDATTYLSSPAPPCLSGEEESVGLFLSNTSCETRLSKDEGDDEGQVLLLVGGGRDVLVMVTCRGWLWLLLDGLLRAVVTVTSSWWWLFPSSSLLFLLVATETADTCWLDAPGPEIRSSSTAACLQEQMES